MLLHYVLLINLAAVMAMFGALWGVSLARRDASIVDSFWGLAFVLVAWVSLGTSGNASPPALLIVALVSIWGLRLSGYLTWRNWGKPEDYRYRAMRERHGERFPIVSLFTVFGLQGVLVLVVSLPVQIGIAEAEAWSILALSGVFLWLVGLLFETVGDFQLARFKSDPKNEGQVMDRGLWRYTRHPNYFGDFLVWWGLFLVAARADSWWWTIAGPLVMSILLIRVSGVRLLESSLRKRVDGYEEYRRRTSAFFPLPPKGNSSQA